MGRLDHIVVTAPDLASGVAQVEAVLGVGMSGGGAHMGWGTHNRLLSLGDEIYLEVIARNPDDPQPEHRRMYDLDNQTSEIRLTNWAICSNSIIDAMSTAPVQMGEIAQLSRGNNRWLMSAPKDGKLPFDGGFPAFLQWQTPPPASQLPDVGCRLKSLHITHPEAADLSKVLAKFLTDPRVSVTQGPQKSLRAQIQTPHGLTVLQ